MCLVSTVVSRGQSKRLGVCCRLATSAAQRAAAAVRRDRSKRLSGSQLQSGAPSARHDGMQRAIAGFRRQRLLRRQRHQGHTAMPAASRLVHPDVEELPAEMAQLQAVLHELPADEWARIEPLFSRVIDSTRRRRRILAMVQEALSQLRLDLKYLMFDLEATRRERDEYRRQLEGQA
jgi:hypothetical protein